MFVHQMRSAGVNPFEYTFQQSHKAAELQELYKDLPADAELEDTDIAVAGRIMVNTMISFHSAQ
jgi:lysyl-tRNA synthetase class II